jgi:hypothetical protein
MKIAKDIKAELKKHGIDLDNVKSFGPRADNSAFKKGDN